jgi:ribosomal protein S18 acetylase RimI-like enzyme
MLLLCAGDGASGVPESPTADSHPVEDARFTGADGREAGDRQLPRPPTTFTDQAGREITVRTDDDLDALVAMYDEFTDADRAQGLPPRGETRRRSWLQSLVPEGVHLLAVHDGLAVGHAALVPMSETTHELVVFVRPDYQLAGIGSRLVSHLLGAGRARGVERVWLTVHRHNRVAKRLYRSTGFEITTRGREWEMAREL